MISDSIYTALQSLVSGRVYPMTAPDNPTKPYIIFQRIASNPVNTLSDGVTANQTRLQVDIYDLGYRSCQTLAASVQAAIASNFSQSILQMEQDLYESDVKLYRVMHDYSIWN